MKRNDVPKEDKIDSIDTNSIQYNSPFRLVPHVPDYLTDRGVIERHAGNVLEDITGLRFRKIREQVPVLAGFFKKRYKSFMDLEGKLREKGIYIQLTMETPDEEGWGIINYEKHKRRKDCVPGIFGYYCIISSEETPESLYIQSRREERETVNLLKTIK